MSSKNKIQKAIVIGAGIAGCSSAYALAKRGIAVTLIERNLAIAQEASGNPVAMLYPKLNPSDNALSNISILGFLFTLNLLKHLPHTEKIHKICGQIQLAFNAREREKQKKYIENSNHNFTVQALSKKQASEIAGINLNYGGLYLPQSGWINPLALCEALINNRLISCTLSTQAISIKRAISHWEVMLPDQSLDADIVVICNANDINAFEQSRNIPITPVRGQINLFPANALSQQIKTVICSDHYLSPAINGVNCIGTSYAPNDLNPAISSSDTLSNFNALKKISPSILSSVDITKVTARVAWRSATKDYLPLAGQLLDEALLRKSPPRYNDNVNSLPWLEGLYVNAGHGSKGMITAPICGELIANMVSREPLMIDKKIASNLNPSRFLLRNMGLKMIAQNLVEF